MCDILPGSLGVASRLAQACLIKSHNHNPNLSQLTCKCITQRLYDISSSGNKFNGVTYGILNLPAVFFVLFSTRTDFPMPGRINLLIYKYNYTPLKMSIITKSPINIILQDFCPYTSRSSPNHTIYSSSSLKSRPASWNRTCPRHISR